VIFLRQRVNPFSITIYFIFSYLQMGMDCSYVLVGELAGWGRHSFLFVSPVGLRPDSLFFLASIVH